MATTVGDIVLELNAEKAPLTVENFLRYAESKYYEGTIFHRVMSNFMIQGGGFTAEMDKKTEGLAQANQKRVEERFEERTRYDLHGAHPSGGFSHIAIFHQRRRQRWFGSTARRGGILCFR